MKMNRIMIAAAAALTLVSAQAQETGNEACAALLCMSSPSESSAPHQCKPYVDAYFGIRVYKKGTFSTAFDPAKTAKKRYDTVLAECGDARQEDRDRVHAKFGPLQYSPFVFN
ncbi:hypothetical protein Y695_00184 [Hydrogenophaga sp. T4]|nr:hypothetical protein Y695_00184 [Hydrogenophaga sp. T4]